MIEDAEDRTSRFAKVCSSIFNRLLNFMKNYDGGRRWGDLADNFGSLFEDPQTSENKLKFNEIVAHFMYLVKKKRHKKDECPWLEPGSQTTYVKNLFSELKQKYPSFSYNMNRDFKFKGGFVCVMNNLFAQRQKEWPVSFLFRFLFNFFYTKNITFSLLFRIMEKEQIGSVFQKINCIFLSILLSLMNVFRHNSQ